MGNHETYLSYPTPTSRTDHHNTTSANHERVVTINSNSAAYATITVINNDTITPVNPPTGVQPVIYSKVAVTKVLLNYLLLYLY